MRSRLQGTVSILALLISSLSPVSAQAQEKQHHVYSVKYVCGVNENPLNSTSAIAAAGAYKTDINIQRARHAGEARITVLPSVGRSLASEGSGRTGRSHSTTLVGAEVVTVICQDINDLIDDALTLQFRVGFLRIDSFEPLSVVAVYTAKHCRRTVGSDFLRNTVCDGDTALDVVRYDPVLVEAFEKKDDSKGPD
jgi:hypothetical protein